ncbi:MAG TPA: hypothetical protein VFA66_14725 [Gaiellaceae bacterium]|nr:hypothetical protein [Gaiellaceae bacterium]
MIEVEQVDFVSTPTRDTARAAACHRGVTPSAAGAADPVGGEDAGVCGMGVCRDPGNTITLHRRHAPRVPR